MRNRVGAGGAFVACHLSRRGPSTYTRWAPPQVGAASAAAGLVAGQLQASGTSRSLAAVTPALVGLLGPDQPSEVQRAGLQVHIPR